MCTCILLRKVFAISNFASKKGEDHPKDIFNIGRNKAKDDGTKRYSASTEKIFQHLSATGSRDYEYNEVMAYSTT
jgi:hypothetical protein